MTAFFHQFIRILLGGVASCRAQEIALRRTSATTTHERPRAAAFILLFTPREMALRFGRSCMATCKSTNESYHKRGYAGVERPAAYSGGMSKLSHFDDAGEARMVDVSGKTRDAP